MKDFYEFCDIIEKLRAPGGCPWDREQTHESLKKCLIEEAYEACDAIDGGKPSIIADELGDVLLQVVMHAQIGKEEGTFTIEDVIGAVSRKMIERHPHVFGDISVSSSEEVLINWDAIKKEKRGQKTATEEIEGIAKSLPATLRAAKVIGKAKKAGLYSPSEKKPLTGEEIGALLFKICEQSYLNNVDPETELTSYTKKFIKNLKNIEENS